MPDIVRNKMIRCCSFSHVFKVLCVYKHTSMIVVVVLAVQAKVCDWHVKN